MTFLDFASIDFSGLDLLPLAQTAPATANPTASAASPAVSSIVAIFQGFILGAVQGITEFLPISSTAHLIIFRDLLGWKDTWSKEAIDGIQFGSVIAVIIYFWRDLQRIVGGALSAWQQRDWQRAEWKLFLGIAIGCLPALAGGLALKLVLKKFGIVLDSPWIIGVMSIVMAILLGAAEKYGRRERSFEAVEVKDGILVGLGQMIALIPGASRSGSTLTTGLFLGLTRETAARFSFLLGLPTLTIATLVQGKDAISLPGMALPLIVGIISTFIFSYLSIAWLLKFLQKQTNWVFVWYRLGFGTFLLAAAFGNLLN